MVRQSTWKSVICLAHGQAVSLDCSLTGIALNEVQNKRYQLKSPWPLTARSNSNPIWKYLYKVLVVPSNRVSGRDGGALIYADHFPQDTQRLRGTWSESQAVRLSPSCSFATWPCGPSGAWRPTGPTPILSRQPDLKGFGLTLKNIFISPFSVRSCKNSATQDSINGWLEGKTK